MVGPVEVVGPERFDELLLAWCELRDRGLVAMAMVVVQTPIGGASAAEVAGHLARTVRAVDIVGLVDRGLVGVLIDADEQGARLCAERIAEEVADRCGEVGRMGVALGGRGATPVELWAAVLVSLAGSRPEQPASIERAR
jgi:hypothetical protein